jgi:leucyl aminopeptidase
MGLRGDAPDLCIDFATLTGAARVALGPDLPVLFANDESVASGWLTAGEATTDPLWRLPLWQPYRRLFKSEVADMNNSADGPFAGAIVGALFCESFVPAGVPWAHVDLFAWNPSATPGRPKGGHAQAIHAAFAWLRERYGC